MGRALERLFEAMRGGLIDAVHWAGPWALPGLGLIVLLVLFAYRGRIVSTAGVIFLLAAVALALTIRAVQLGRF